MDQAGVRLPVGPQKQGARGATKKLNTPCFYRVFSLGEGVTRDIYYLIINRSSGCSIVVVYTLRECEVRVRFPAARPSYE